jgi:hypothetical protein
LVIHAATGRQIGGLFECEDLGAIDLKGLPEAASAWRVLSENRTLDQSEALRSGATPLIGRDEEMDFLLRRGAQAEAGNGRVVLISAEPGVGGHGAQCKCKPTGQSVHGALEGCAGHLQRCNEPGVPLGDEYIFDYNVVAARAAHSQGIPGIEDFHLARRR